MQKARLLIAVLLANSLFLASTSSADVINVELDAEVFFGEVVLDTSDGFDGVRIRTYDLGIPIDLRANTEYTINISFMPNQALRVFASEAANGFEDVALTNFILADASPGSASGNATLDGIGGDYIGTNPFMNSGTFFASDDPCCGSYVLGVGQDLTDTSFLFTGISFQFTTSSDFMDVTNFFSGINVAGGGFEVVSVSEPGTLAILGLGLFGLGLAGRRKA
ncbi:MAG: PEP-CTERM sorting domain-containing protein [Woeseiaceae bacterium]|nr:PEP-CTERM sorting domain-containing protein [Woeseiaceae bacterium]